MKDLYRQGEALKQYAPEIRKMIEDATEQIINDTTVDVSIVEGNLIQLSIGDVRLIATPEQVVDLMQEMRRAVVKTKPKALRSKFKELRSRGEKR